MTPDELCLAVIQSGHLEIDVEAGTAFTKRFWGKQLGCTSSKGYTVCTLHFNGERKQIKFHRLIWIAKHGIPPVGMMPDHINRIRTDNRISNLRLTNSKGNAQNRRDYHGENSPSAKLNRENVIEIFNSYNLLKSYAKVAKQFNVSRSLIAQIIRKEIWI